MEIYPLPTAANGAEWKNAEKWKVWATQLDGRADGLFVRAGEKN